MQSYRAYRDRSKKAAIQNEKRKARENEDRVGSTCFIVTPDAINRCLKMAMATGTSPVAISPAPLYNEQRDMALYTQRCLVLDKDSNKWLSILKGKIQNIRDIEHILQGILLDNMLQNSKRWKRYVPGTDNIIYVPPVLYRPLIELNITDEDKL